MKTTISVIKADIGSIGGHICPSKRLVDTVRAQITEYGTKLLLDNYISLHRRRHRDCEHP